MNIWVLRIESICILGYLDIWIFVALNRIYQTSGLDSSYFTLDNFLQKNILFIIWFLQNVYLTIFLDTYFVIMLLASTTSNLDKWCCAVFPSPSSPRKYFAANLYPAQHRWHLAEDGRGRGRVTRPRVGGCWLGCGWCWAGVAGSWPSSVSLMQPLVTIISQHTAAQHNQQMDRERELDLWKLHYYSKKSGIK